MPNILFRSINEPIREDLTRNQLWEGHDKGLIWCWELGRIFRREGRECALKASANELPLGDWKGGVEKRLMTDKKYGSLQYLAQWQGMRGEDLNLQLDGQTKLICSRTNQPVLFSAMSIDEDQ
jgi:hypothetical protein